MRARAVHAPAIRDRVPDEVPVGGAQRENRSAFERDDEPPVVPERPDDDLVRERQLPRDRTVSGYGER